MTHSPRIWIAATVLASYVTTAAGAATPVPAPVSLRVGIVQQSAAAVTLTDCFADVKDSGSGTRNFYIDFAARFKNTDARSVTAVRLRFDAFTNFNEPIRTVYGIDHDVLAPGESRDDALHDARAEDTNHHPRSFVDPIGQRAAEGFIIPGDVYRPTWEFVNVGVPATVLCSIASVAFADGTVWQAPPLDAAALAQGMKAAKSGPYMFSSAI